METVDLHQLPEGSVIEVQEASEFPAIKSNPAPAPAYLCADSQLRLVTIGRGKQLFGGDTREEVVSKLQKLGYKPLVL